MLEGNNLVDMIYTYCRNYKESVYFFVIFIFNDVQSAIFKI